MMWSLRSRLWLGVLVLLFLTMLVTLSYGYILSLDFTGSDALYLIKTSRISNWRDLRRIFGRGIMGGEFYRPIAQLSYSLDFALSQTRPVGYHLTDLWLHLAVTLQLTLLARRWNAPGGWIGAGLGGALFTLHPILVESIPAVARRHDLLASAFGLAAILLFGRRWYRAGAWQGILAVLLALLALGSKEIAALVPVLVILDAWLRFARHPHHVQRPLSITLACVAATVLFLLWRRSRGAMGVDPRAVLGHLSQIWRTTTAYFTGLLCPFGSVGEGVGAALTTASLLALLWLIARAFLQRSSLRFYALAAGWVLGGWGLLALTHRPDPRNFYLPAGGIALLVGGALGELVTQARENARLKTAVVILLPVVAMALGWALASPLLNTYPGWRTGSALTDRVLEVADSAAQLMPSHSTLYLVNLPKAVISSSPGLHERSVSVMRDHSVQSWLDMNSPDHPVQVEVCSYRVVPSGQDHPTLIAHFYGDAAVIVVATKPEERDAPWRYFWHEACQVLMPEPKGAVRTRLPRDAKRVDAFLGESLVLEGYRLPRRELEAGQTLSLMLYWRAREPIARSYTVFVQLLDEKGKLQAQQDGPPVSGTYSTDQWPTDTFIADGHGIVVDPSTSSGRYSLVAGMYDLATMERLPAYDCTGQRLPNDAIPLTGLTIEGTP